MVVCKECGLVGGYHSTSCSKRHRTSEHGTSEAVDPNLGRAVLFILKDDGQVSHEVFLEDTSEPLDPYHRASQMLSIVEKDFGDAIFSIGQNERSKALMQGARMKEMGFPINADGTWTE